MCRLTWSSSSLAVLTRGPRTQRLQPNHVIFVSKSSRRINYTQETAEPLGVSPPEAVDLLLIKRLRACPRGSLPSQTVDISDVPFSLPRPPRSTATSTRACRANGRPE